MRYEAIEAEKAAYPIAMMCEVMEVSRSGYYAWQNREPSDRDKDNATLASEIASIFEDSRGTYGSPRVHAELQEQGCCVGRKRVERQMREQGLVARRKPKFRRTTDSNHGEPIAPNHVAREFETDEPDRVWVADISAPQKAAREMGDRPLAIGLQEQVANHRKRLGSKAPVVSVAEKVPSGIRYGPRRRTTVNCRSSVESAQMMSKPGVDVGPGSAWRKPVYWPCDIRHRGSAILVQALVWNCGNLRLRCEGKGTSPTGEADNTDAQPRGGATRSSVEAAVMAVEQRGRVIGSWVQVNRFGGRSLGA